MGERRTIRRVESMNTLAQYGKGGIRDRNIITMASEMKIESTSIISNRYGD
jgi:hypothetical protein